MANTSYLQLYLDTDFILPVAVGADGNVVKYQNQEGDSRLWLYFSKASGRDVYETGSVQKANFEAKIEGNFGDFWTHLEQGDKVAAEPFTYVDLLDVAGIYSALREWFKALLMTDTPEVVLNFASTIGLKARRQLVDFLTKKGLTVRSYSVELNDLVAEKVVHDDRSMVQREFGDQLLVIQSTGNHILLSTLTWCGEVFMQGDKPAALQKIGDDFKKMALAKMVVEKAERHYNILQPSEIEAEIVYQAQFAERWLANSDGDTIWTDGFHYSKSPGRIYPPEQINAAQLEKLVEENSRQTTGQIAKFYKENIVDKRLRHWHTVFIGDVFRDEKFLSSCIDVTSSQEKSTFYNDNTVQEAMGRFFYSHGQEVEPVGELERRYLTLASERERIRQYVKNAETLGKLRNAIGDSIKEVSMAIAQLKSRTTDIEEAWEACMKQSKFEEAQKLLKGMAIDDALTLALSHLVSARQEVGAHLSLLTDLRQLNEVHIKEIVDDIERGDERLNDLRQEADGLQKQPAALAERTQHYKECYPIYLAYKQKLDNEPSLDGKRDILKEVTAKDLTMEALPAIDVKTVTVGLTCELQVSRSGFLGLKKEKSLHVVMQVKNNDTLQFPCVLMISNKKDVKVDRRAWCADIEKEASSYETTVPLSALPAPSDGSLVVQLLPNEESSHLTSRLYCESKRINL